MPVSDIRDILGHASDRNACRDRLIGQFSSWFEHSLHHLPTGVICEHDNAPENLVEKLNLFCELVDEAGRTEEFASDISFWRLHFEGYCDYLANRHTYPSYRDYLAKHGRL